MKKIIPLLFCTFTFYSHAQEIDCKKFVQTEIINKIKNYPPTDLVPYSTDGKKWSLMDVKSKKIITNPFMESRSTFHPSLLVYPNNNCTSIEVANNFNIQEVNFIDRESPSRASLPTIEGLGFEVDENGTMTAYSKKYKHNSDDMSNISKAIKHNNEYFAIIRRIGENLIGEHVLINQKGQAQSGFVFKDIKLLPYLYENENLLYIEDFNGKQGFITLRGEHFFYGELIRYPFNNSFGYSVQNNITENKENITNSGVIDLTTLQWLIKPQEKYKIYDIVYTSSEEISTSNPKNRNKANIYFLATQNGEHFVLDINGNAIKPN
ncbi:hypothetical protein H1R17_05660 [Flavobacterium sp. xlx-214]|uniref:hypothetical protein n=1 Tax=unclassified Flavobacterium TaxID=196869 RepID=UPI0013D5CF1C|nr:MULTISPECIES: hypothetical protein [unclassified Flavobacterium]MBA5793063.1 hypothetical protein [Flavobacterium sp. xlx-221]QMI84609.1 hypothetical protein H1R17_05660 [Flavobacterium sp. xlx-214]